MFTINELIQATGGRVRLAGRGSAYGGISIDSRTVGRKEVFLAIKGDRFDGHDFLAAAVERGAGCLVVRKKTVLPSRILQRGVSVIEVGDTLCALGALAAFNRARFSIPLIAVTGSNGKTTTKDMIAWVLEKNYKVLKNEGTKNNHIGVPLTLLRLTREHEVAVIELGTSGPGEIARLARICAPTVAVITAIGPSHLERLIDLKGVYEEKRTLLDYLQAPRLVFVNADDPYLARGLLAPSNRRHRSAGTGPFVCGFGINAPCDFRASSITQGNKDIRFVVNRKNKFTLNSVGYYNIYNSLAASAVGLALGVSFPESSRRLRSFVFPKGRLQMKLIKQASFIDDTYNANPLSLEQALRALETSKTRGRKIVVMGDMLELGERATLYHRKAGKRAAQVCDVLITVGALSAAAAGGARSSGMEPSRIFSCKNSQEARAVLFDTVAPTRGDIVLVKGSRMMKMEEVFTLP